MPEMKPIAFSFELPGTIETAWKWLTEEEYQKKWMTGLISLKREDGSTQYAPGSRWHMVMQEGKKQKDYFASMPLVEKPHRFTLEIEAENLAPGGKIKVDYRLTPDGNHTRLDYHSQLVADRFSLMLKVLSPLIIMMIKSNTRKMFKSMIRQMGES